MKNNLIIAIDGTAASGKGTLAKRISKEFEFAYLDVEDIRHSAKYHGPNFTIMLSKTLAPRIWKIVSSHRFSRKLLFH